MKLRQVFKIITSILMITSIAISSESMAAFVDGNKLKEYLSNTGSASDYAMGFIIGVADSHSDTLVCPPIGVTVGQMVDVARKYLNENPDKLHYAAYTNVAIALMHAFPCKLKK
jgi:hypothetical protein